MSLTEKVIVLALLAQAFSILMNIYSLKIKAKNANLIFHWWEIFVDDWPRIAAILVVVIIGVMFIPYAPPNTNPLVFLIGALLVGYMGNDILLRVIGAANARLNAAIDYKTNAADEAAGIPKGTLTPAAKQNKQQINS